MGLETDDAFSQGLKSLECVKILFNCLQNLERGRSKKLSSLMTCTKPLILSRKNLKNLEEILKEKEEEIKLLEK